MDAITLKGYTAPIGGPALADPATGPVRSLIDAIVQSLDDDKAENTVVIDLEGRTTLADAMVVASGRSARHVAAISNHLLENLKAGGYKQLSAEGLNVADWVLIDAGDVLVHVFRPEIREFYNIEGMWGDAGTADQEVVAGSERAGLHPV